MESLDRQTSWVGCGSRGKTSNSLCGHDDISKGSPMRSGKMWQTRTRIIRIPVSHFGEGTHNAIQENHELTQSPTLRSVLSRA